MELIPSGGSIPSSYSNCDVICVYHIPLYDNVDYLACILGYHTRLFRAKDAFIKRESPIPIPFADDTDGATIKTAPIATVDDSRVAKHTKKGNDTEIPMINQDGLDKAQG